MLPTFIHSWVWVTVRGSGGVLGVFLSRVSRVRPGLSVGSCGWEWVGDALSVLCVYLLGVRSRLLGKAQDIGVSL